MKCLLNIKYDSKVSEMEADDISNLMNEWLPRNYFTDKQKFKEMIENENNDQMFGQVFYTFELPNQGNFYF